MFQRILAILTLAALTGCVTGEVGIFDFDGKAERKNTLRRVKDMALPCTWSFGLMQPVNGLNFICRLLPEKSRNYRLKGFYRFSAVEVKTIKDQPGGGIDVYLKECDVYDLPDEYRKPYPSSIVFPSDLKSKT